MTPVDAALEDAPETASYRKSRVMLWQQLCARFAEGQIAAKLQGLVGEAGKRAAARALRGDLRRLMAELLVRAPVPALHAFLGVARDWGAAGERLLERGDAVSELAASAYPRATWTQLEWPSVDAAQDDARWSAWTRAWMEALSAGTPTVLRKEETKALTTPGPRGWSSWMVGAVAVLGVTTALVVASREE